VIACRWVLSLVLVLAAAGATGDSPSSTPEPSPTPRAGPAALIDSDPETAAPSAEAPEGTFAIPDAPTAWQRLAHFKSEHFTIKFGFVVIGDYDAFSQDAASVSQVGVQDDQWDLRAARLMTRGVLKLLSLPIQYNVSGEFKGFDRDPNGATFGFTDVWVAVPVGSLFRATYGKTKEPFVYEMVGDAANLMQLERILSPFFVSRNVGLRLDNTALDDRMTWSVGWWNDWWVKGQPFHESGNDFAARVTYLPLWSEGGGYLHVGASVRYNGADNDTIRLKGKNESNVTSDYVDTGNLHADHQWEAGVEALWACRGFSLGGEYVRSWVRSADSGNPSFSGWYVVGSWVLTGEHRPYDRKVGYARRVLPTHRWGAPELVARYSHLDLDDGAVQGGRLDKWFFGANWWATRHWKLGAGYGLAYLHRFGVQGRTDSWQFRIQTVY
jgi:phosphate-selective porin OprO and OprP